MTHNTTNPHAPKKKDDGLSAGAKVVWGLILAPFALAGIVAFAIVLLLLVAVLSAPIVWVMWNWGLHEAAPLVGVALPTIGIAKAFAVSLSMAFFRSVFGGSSTARSVSEKAQDKRA